jgi:sensor histidine kinase YesM
MIDVRVYAAHEFHNPHAICDQFREILRAMKEMEGALYQLKERLERLEKNE